MQVMRGEIWMANLDGAQGCELQGNHPVVIISNDKNNLHSPIVTIAPITSAYKRQYIAQIRVPAGAGNLKKNSEILCNQIRTLDKIRLQFKIGQFDNQVMSSVKFALKFHLEAD